VLGGKSGVDLADVVFAVREMAPRLQVPPAIGAIVQMSVESLTHASG
jgi:hypothetical protein